MSSMSLLPWRPPVGAAPETTAMWRPSTSVARACFRVRHGVAVVGDRGDDACVWVAIQLAI
jgi:hypothetical protein